MADRPHDRTAPGTVWTAEDLTVLRLLAQGMAASEVADVLDVSLLAVAVRLTGLRRRAGVRSTAEVVELARARGLLGAPAEHD